MNVCIQKPARNAGGTGVDSRPLFRNRKGMVLDAKNAERQDR